MKIDTEKCNAWFDLALSLIRKTDELNIDEAKYIKAGLLLGIATSQIEKLNGKLTKHTIDRKSVV